MCSFGPYYHPQNIFLNILYFKHGCLWRVFPFQNAKSSVEPEKQQSVCLAFTIVKSQVGWSRVHFLKRFLKKVFLSNCNISETPFLVQKYNQSPQPPIKLDLFP